MRSKRIVRDMLGAFYELVVQQEVMAIGRRTIYSASSRYSSGRSRDSDVSKWTGACDSEASPLYGPCGSPQGRLYSRFVNARNLSTCQC